MEVVTCVVNFRIVFVNLHPEYHDIVVLLLVAMYVVPAYLIYYSLSPSNLLGVTIISPYGLVS